MGKLRHLNRFALLNQSAYNIKDKIGEGVCYTPDLVKSSVLLKPVLSAWIVPDKQIDKPDKPDKQKEETEQALFQIEVALFQFKSKPETK